jgi:hypothetical protein
MLINNIIYEIHIWRFVVSWNQSSTKLNKLIFMNVHKTLYMQNDI